MADTISGITQLNGAATQARVTLINSVTKAVVSSLLSNASTGVWEFTGLAAGTYEIIVVKAGYKARCDGPWVLDGVAPFDPYGVNYASLLHFDGADASTTFTDQSGKVWTANGNAQIDTAQSKFGGSALLLDGAGDYLTTPAHADFAFGTGQFTVEFWVRVAGAGDHNVQHIFQTRDGANNGLLIQYTRSTGFIDVVSDSVIAGITSGALADNQWYHFAVSRASGGEIRAFIDGVQIGTTFTSAQNFNANTVFLGRRFDNDGFWHYFNGHIDELRVTKGKALYTANFTPPAQAHPNGRTLSLLHFEGTNGASTITDQVAGTTWTGTGSTAISTADKKFGSSSVKSSPSTGHHFSSTSPGVLSLGSGAFCFEFFVKYAALPSGLGQAVRMEGGGGFSIGHFFGNLCLENEGNARITGPATATGQWYHIAVTKSGNTFTLYVDGVSQGTWSNASNFTGTRLVLAGSDSGYLDGYVDEFRVTRDDPRYTANFTPPAAPFPNP